MREVLPAAGRLDAGRPPRGAPAPPSASSRAGDDRRAGASGCSCCRSAADLFYVIPWPYRKAAGWVALRRPAGPVPGPPAAGPPHRRRPPPEDDAAPHRLAWILPLACVALAVPLLQHPENLGFGDWDLFLREARGGRGGRSLLWGQFPWWDPWCRGGFPLAANPQCGVISVAMPLILAFGTSVGMRLATIACFLLACEGARRLALIWLADPYAAVAAGLIYGLNGGVLVASVAALSPDDVLLRPALAGLLHLPARSGGASDALWLGFWLAFNILNGIQYFSVYAVLIVSVLWLRAARVRAGRLRWRFLAHTVLALGTFLALAGWRLATTGLVYRDFPRHLPSGCTRRSWTIWTHLLDRPSAARLPADGHPVLLGDDPVHRAGGARPGPGEPRLGLAVVAHPGVPLRMAGGGVRRLVSPQLLAAALPPVRDDARRDPMAVHGHARGRPGRGQPPGPLASQPRRRAPLPRPGLDPDRGATTSPTAIRSWGSPSASPRPRTASRARRRPRSSRSSSALGFPAVAARIRRDPRVRAVDGLRPDGPDGAALAGPSPATSARAGPTAGRSSPGPGARTGSSSRSSRARRSRSTRTRARGGWPTAGRRSRTGAAPRCCGRSWRGPSAGAARAADPAPGPGPRPASPRRDRAAGRCLDRRAPATRRR